ncbi:MAG: CinA family protein [Rhodocyclaceae bacterium]|nr:CinA family protein [Rhodocyclaceae bacterium]
MVWLATELGHTLREQGRTIATAESCTGGLLAAALTEGPGSSAWFMAGWVTYSNAAKQRDLGVDDALILEHGAVSGPVVAAMAQGARRRAGTDWAIAVSGVAGPGGGSAAKPVGTVWLAWAGATAVRSECCHFDGPRALVRHAAVCHALATLLECLR